jgi:hypothetical protein
MMGRPPCSSPVPLLIISDQIHVFAKMGARMARVVNNLCR